VLGASINQVFIMRDRLVVKYAYDRVKYAAMTTLKEKIPGRKFNFFGLREWSFPIEAVNTVLEALKPFQDFV